MEGFSENISYLGLAAVATGLIYAGAHEGLEVRAPPVTPRVIPLVC